MAVVILGNSYNDRVSSSSSILVPEEGVLLSSSLINFPSVTISTGGVEGGEPGVIDHGDLTGLSNNDHNQYALLDASNQPFTGNVGINTTDFANSDTFRMHRSAAGDYANIRLTNLTTGTGADKGIGLSLTTGGKGALILYENTDLDIYTNNTKRATFNSYGGLDVIGSVTGGSLISDGDLTLGSGTTVDTIETTLTDDNTHIPTSGAVYDVVSGYVTGSGSDNQVAVFSASSVVEGDSNLTYVSGSGLLTTTNIDITNDLSVDTIVEYTGSAGVTIEGVILKDTKVGIGLEASSYELEISGSAELSGVLYVDTIVESTTDGGVTIESLTFEDRNIDFTGTSTITDNSGSPAGFQYNADYSATFTNRSLVDKGYVDTVASTGITWLEAVIDIINFTTNEPASPDTGDRYINSATGNSSETTQSMTADYIYEWNGVDWTETVPSTGNSLFVANNLVTPENDVGQHTYNSGWVYIGGSLAHNDTTSKQGGTPGEYYHLTSAELSKLQSIPSNADAYLNWNIIINDVTGTEYPITSDEVVNFVQGSNVTISYGSAVGDHDITISSTDTTYSGGDGINITGSTISVDLETGGGLEFGGLGVDELAVDFTVVAQASHSHNSLYYTETEVDTWRNGVSQTEMGYLDGVTGDIQNQLDSKDNYQHWKIYTDNTYRASITSTDDLEFVGGDSITLTYDSFGGDGDDGPRVTIDYDGAAGLSSAYDAITDGVTTAEASGGDTFRLRSSNNKLVITVGSNDVTYGDNALFTLSEANINHNALDNYSSTRHFLMTEIDHLDTGLSTGLVKVTTGTGVISIVTDSSANWNTAYGWGNHASAGYMEDLSDDLSPTLGGDLALASGAYIKIPHSVAQGTGAGIIIEGTVDENPFGIGCALGMVSNGHWESCDADNPSDFPCSGLALDSGTGTGKNILIYGTLSDASYSFTPGLPVYVSEVIDGGLTTAPVAGTGDTLQRVGIAIDADTVLFTPSLDVIEID